VEIPVAVVELMIEHSRASLPAEACGLIAADERGRVTAAYCLRNVDASAVSYTVDPAEHFESLRHAESRGWHLAGVFHSHPSGPPVPSSADVAGALEPEWVYLIVGLGGEEASVRGFRIIGGRVTEVPMVVVEDA